MAEFIANLADPFIDVPEKFAALLDATIGLRESFTGDFHETSTSKPNKASEKRHTFLLDVLKGVRGVLESRLPASSSAAEPHTVEEMLDRFQHLELEEPSQQAFEKAPVAASAHAPPLYKAERPCTMEEDFFAMNLLLHDLGSLRAEVARAWAGFKRGTHDVVAASITTNTAVVLAHAMLDDMKTTFAKHGGPMKMLAVIYHVHCLTDGTAEDFRERPGDAINFKMCKIADHMMWPVIVLLEAWADMHKVNPHPDIKKGFYGTYDPASDRTAISDREKFAENQVLLLEMLPEFYFFCHGSKNSPPPVEDELIR
jgi:hypothetical protein